MSDLVELCQKLVQFQSVGNNCTEALLFLKNFLEQNNFSARIVDFEAEGKKVSNLCASFGSGKPHLLFVGHIDVVPANDISLWKYSPFAAKIENNILYGRGIADMKGGIACFLQACRDFTQNNDFSGKISLIISGDEEEPIVEGSKKMLKLLSEEQEHFDFAIVGEPSNPLTMGDEIKIGRRGDMVLNITSYGQSGHTAYSDVNSNPVHNLINLLYSLQHDKLDDGNAYFAPSSLHITTFDVNNKASNVVPHKAFAQIDIRFNSEHTFAD
ncbi:MAG: succinyl-diaminopimelate desuccinylase, partial [Alphaproteobacteria bacterium]|nr:succinyl-diaminopimelate desuccinylase [Alphaproteobacteria bacterium]